VTDRRDPLVNSGGYVAGGYSLGPRVVPWGVEAPSKGADRPAELRAARELELATTADDNLGIGRLKAGPTAIILSAFSVAALWVLGGPVGFFVAVITGGLAAVHGLRARRSAHYAHNRAWWLGTTALMLVVASFVGCLVVNVLVPDNSRGGASCVTTGTCPAGAGA